MNSETLENLLEEVQNLKSENHHEAEILKIRIIDCLRELGLYDPNASRLATLRFTPLSPRLASPFERSISTMSGILKSKIDILKSREHELNTARLNEMQNDIMNNDLMQRLKEQEATFKYRFAAKESENQDLQIKLNSLQTELDSQTTTNLKLEKANKKWIWFLKLTSAGMWAFIVSSFIAIAIWMYELGKDNATKADDTEKAILRKSNIGLQDSVVMLKLKVDSLQKSNKKD